MKCLETRRRASGLTYRRYETDDGLTFTTFELPVSVVRAFGMKDVKRQLDAFARGEALRKLVKQRRASVAAFVDEGLSNAAIGKRLGITEARVRQIRAELGKEKRKCLKSATTPTAAATGCTSDGGDRTAS